MYLRKLTKPGPPAEQLTTHPAGLSLLTSWPPKDRANVPFSASVDCLHLSGPWSADEVARSIVSGCCATVRHRWNKKRPCDAGPL